MGILNLKWQNNKSDDSLFLIITISSPMIFFSKKRTNKHKTKERDKKIKNKEKLQYWKIVE